MAIHDLRVAGTARATTFEDIQMCLGHANRIAILLRLAEADSDVTGLGEALGFALPLLSNHLAVLRRTKLVEPEWRKGHRVYALGDRVSFRQRSDGVELTVQADDGSRVGISIPFAAPVMRVLRPGNRRWSLAAV